MLRNITLSPLSWRRTVTLLGGFLKLGLLIFSFILLQTLCEHLEEQNVDGFTEAVKEYDSISRLDQWYTTILLRIKKQANDNPDLR